MFRLYRIAMFSLMFVMLAFASVAFAQDGPPDPKAALAHSIELLTPVLVPFIVWITRSAIPKIPSMMLPILASVLGVVVTQIGALATGGHYGVIGGALLGLAGVGVREVLNQVIKAGQPT